MPDMVLIAEDEREVRDYLGLALQLGGYRTEFAQDGQEALDFLEQSSQDVSLLLLDLIMPRKDGLETLRSVRTSWPQLPVITVSGCCTRANVASAMKGGAVDFLPKPVSHEQLLGAIQSALVSSSWVRDKQLPNILNLPGQLSSIEAWAERTELLLSRVGASDAPVLLRGETGAGKEVFARKLHARSKRAHRPFLKLNCAAFPSDLIESELFGYEKGAFTGAFKTNSGKFELAEGGTILLDEIGDMDFKLQAKLLGVLQDKEIVRLGSKTTLKVDVRIMAATHCNLEDAIIAGRFREDLYYRLNILDIYVPPLRERKDEILRLTEVFIQKYAPLDPISLPHHLQEALLAHDWPGNVRELENVVRKFLVFRDVGLIVAELKAKVRTSKFPRSAGLAQGPETSTQSFSVTAAAGSSTAAYFPDQRSSSNGFPLDQSATGIDQKSPEATVPAISSLPRPIPSTMAQLEDQRKTAEIRAIVGALESTLWNRKHAAKVLRMDYKALLYKMKKLGIGETAN